jgi:hypothetical protein
MDDDEVTVLFRRVVDIISHQGRKKGKIDDRMHAPLIGVTLEVLPRRAILQT